MYCINEEALSCPITKLSFPEINGKVQVIASVDPADGLPIIDLKLSQNGKPCFSKESFNSDFESKKGNPLKVSDMMGKQFDTECDKVMNNLTPLKEDVFWKHVSNFPNQLIPSEW